MKIYTPILLGILILFLASCHKGNMGGGCVPGPGNTHAFLYYTGYNNYSTANNSEVFRIEMDKTQLSKITNIQIGGNGFSGLPQIIDLTSVYFISDSGGKKPNRLFSQSNDGLGLKNILSTNLPLPSSYSIVGFSISPDKQNIAIICNPCPQCYILRVSFPLGVFNLITNKYQSLGTAYSHCDWSKDGARVYFDLIKNGVTHIFGINPDSTNLVQITQSTFGEDYPVVSPNGKFLAISSYMNAEKTEREICLVNVDGNNLHAITHLGSNALAKHPAWSPLADQIFYSYTDITQPTLPPHIFSSILDGSVISAFTSGGGEDYPFVAFNNQ